MTPQTPVRRWGCALALGVGALSCTPPTARVATPHAATTPDACTLSSDSTPIPDTLTIALAGAVDPGRAPIPETDAERMVFRQLYETLVRVDCAGAIRPGLATAWASGDSDRRWTFTLRPDARFWDGQAVTAGDVIAAWSGGTPPLPTGTAIAAPDDRTVVVTLSTPTPALPRQLADPALAVTRSLPDQDWPTGSGDYTADTSRGRVILAPFTGGGRPVIVLRPLGVNDARDWIDRGVDLLATDDAAALSYAAGRSDLASRPLPWDRSYVLLVRGAAPSMAGAWRSELAQDAVHVAARPAALGWWTAFPACVGAPPSGVSPAPVATAVIVYPREDPTARDLAGRLVALESVGSGPALRASGLSLVELDAALAAGSAAQYVVSIPQAALEPCRAVRRLVSRAPWLTLAAQLVPLVDTRRQVVWRRGAPAFTVDWDATLRVR